MTESDPVLPAGSEEGSALACHELHARLGATFGRINGMEMADHYGDPLLEREALIRGVGVLDLSFRARLCLVGPDRQRFINGQVTNDIRVLKPGQGCYAALVNAKARMQSDLNLHVLEDEILMDFEPGYSAAVTARLNPFIIAEDVEVVDVGGTYGLWSIQGPGSKDALQQALGNRDLPSQPFHHVTSVHPEFGAICVAQVSRLGSSGFDLFVPMAGMAGMGSRLLQSSGARACGWQALERARIEAGIPRFGADMDESTLPPEAGIQERAISYTKGCYIGQEVISRIRTYGQVARSLRVLRVEGLKEEAPRKGDKLYLRDREVGQITSAIAPSSQGVCIGLGYVRRECNEVGTVLRLLTPQGGFPATVAGLPFKPA